MTETSIPVFLHHAVHDISVINTGLWLACCHDMAWLIQLTHIRFQIRCIQTDQPLWYVLFVALLLGRSPLYTVMLHAYEAAAYLPWEDLLHSRGLSCMQTLMHANTPLR